MLRKMIMISLSISLLMASGCTNRLSKEPVTLTINFPSEKLFYQMYGHDFEDKYSHITIHVIEEDLSDESTEPSADVLFMDQVTVYNRLIDEGKLLNLEQKLRDEKYPISEFSPVVANALRSETDGLLYALSPSFISHAIYYNKDLFNQYGIPFPQNQMTWEEVLDLAKRFPERNADGEALYGFKSNYYINIPFSMILRIGQTEGLTFMDARTLQVNMDSAAWHGIFQTVIDAFRDKAVYDKDDDPTGEIEPAPILTGHAAMEIQSYTTAYNFEDYSHFIGAKSVNWDMVTVPVGSRSRGQSDYYEVQEIYGISAKTEHEEEAWELVQFITNDAQKMKKNQQDQISMGLPAQTDLIKPVDGHDLSPLYELDPVTKSNNPYDYIHYEIINAFKEVGQNVIQEAIENKITIDDAIEKIEKDGQAAIDEMKLKLEQMPDE
ncbi:ABC transporter substrate-binding protein [Paenibacillus sp. DYY-L-2]|uniref:ABC transporter substrate-binding protein n=1 Tax=Paenibacillus sp. DYY-L-2 TaxID=3447013 RepID=UPI003F4F4C12